MTPPTFRTREARKAVCRFEVKTPACKPNRDSLTFSNASSSEETLAERHDRSEDFVVEYPRAAGRVLDHGGLDNGPPLVRHR